VRITNVGGFTTRNPLRTLFGALDDTSIHSVRVVRNDSDVIVVAASNGVFSFVAALKEGINTFKATVGDASTGTKTSDPVSYTYFVNHAPTAVISYQATPTQVMLSALSSTDPDAGQGAQLSFVWSADAGNPEPSFSGTLTQPSITIQRPKTPGDYAFTLIATDPSGLKDTTRSFFSILDDGSFQNPTIATAPRWAKSGRIYELFFKSLTPAGTINAALSYLPYFKNLGVNILWVMPVMTNAAPMNNESGTGYNIKDFFTVAPEYGTNDDFRNFVNAAHRYGLKVILDVTPNHTSYLHPFVLHGRQYRENSPYWTFYQHTVIPHNENGVGPQVLDADGYVYYSAFSSQLLNYNWSDVDARTYMIEAYKWWIKQFDIDGYRFDVYWGPRRRANNGSGGENDMGVPMRSALKHVKADILLLAEDDGTGLGTEVIFGDRSGGVDAGYDWRLYGSAINPFYARGSDLNNLNTYITNFGGTTMGFIPGPNSLFLRFLENHDEDRIASIYGSYEKTMPIGTVTMTSPGLPLIYSGQEVGYGLGLPTLDLRRRGVIDWNASGKSLLSLHYQRLATIRAQFPAFSTQLMNRVTTGNASVYAYTRPYPKGNGVVLVNTSGTSLSGTVYLDRTNMDTTACQCNDLFGNDLYNDTTYVLPYVGGRLAADYSLKPYGSAVYVVADTPLRLVVPSLATSVPSDRIGAAAPSSFKLYPNYPNPFNPLTIIRYDVARPCRVRVKVFNMLAEEVASLVDQQQPAGSYAIQWNGTSHAGSVLSTGVYFVRIEAGDFVTSEKMVHLK
jgi:cyclomaltodextrinase